MSGFAYPNTIFNSPCYNPAFYVSVASDGYITYESAKALFLETTDSRLVYISGITVGTAGAGTALITDASKNIIGIGSLSATYLTGTLQTAAQSNITSVGTLTELTVSGNAKVGRLWVGDSTDTTRMISCTDATMVNGANRFITLGKANSSYNQAEIQYFHTSDGNTTNNKLRLGFYSKTCMTIQTNGFVGIGNDSPTDHLTVAGNIVGTMWCKTTSGFEANGITCINNTGTFVGSGGLNTSGRILSYNSFGISVFNDQYNTTELRLISENNRSTIGNTQDHPLRITTGGTTKFYSAIQAISAFMARIQCIRLLC